MARNKYIHRRYRAKLCRVCQNEFTGVRRDAKTCSPKCRKVLSRWLKQALAEYL
jgi:predicted nucleic acid-binding Zn ribbon protein